MTNNQECNKDKCSANSIDAVTLVRSGVENARDYSVYTSTGGYSAFWHALDNMSSDTVLSVIRDSGLRGKGGAGFETYKKWELAIKTSQELGVKPILIVNGDHGIIQLETDPHAVIEGMLIAAWTTGAKEGILYTRRDYVNGLESFNHAFDQVKKNGLLENSEKKFSFKVSIRYSPGSFIGGQSGAACEYLSGRAAEPVSHYVHLAESGFRGLPTIFNNIETISTIPFIVKNGAEAYKEIGKGKGVKLFTISGKVKKPVTKELPMAACVRCAIDKLADGMQEGSYFKAAQIGGSTGGFIPESMLDITLDYESLKEAGAIVGFRFNNCSGSEVLYS
jgi:NADH:ubiquinone oxidoreductase subunit F (NADH-binding)